MKAPSAGASARAKDNTSGADRAQFVPTPARQGKKAIAGYFDPAVSFQLQDIALERKRKGEHCTMQDLFAEALNLLFTKYKKPPIA